MDPNWNIEKLTTKSETQFKKICDKLHENHKKQSVYHRLLNELVETVVNNDPKKSEKIARFVAHFTEIEDKTSIKEWFLNTSHQLNSTNLIILCCKFNRNEILEFLLNKNNGIYLKNFSENIEIKEPSPIDRDDEQHNAFYYGMRNGNLQLLELLVQFWSDNNSNTDMLDKNEELPQILGETFEELINKNVDVTEQVKDFVTKQIFDIYFKFDEISNTTFRRNNKTNDELKTSLKLRIELVLDNIDRIINEYSKGKEFDLKLLFLCRTLAKDIYILKKRLKSTYSFMPWEEIEFIIIAFVLSQTTRQKINLFFLMTFRENKFFKHLNYFGEKLKAKSSQLIEHHFKPSDLPRTHRHLLVAKLRESDEQYRELIDDFETIKDVYSFQKIIEAIDSALDIDSSDPNAPLVGIRVLQIIGECLKNTLESPNLSSASAEKFLAPISKNFRDILMTLRNSFSHARGLIKRFEMLQGMQKSGGAFITAVQKDLRDIRKIIVQIVHKKEFNLICEILLQVFKSESAEEIQLIVNMIECIDFDASDVIKTEEMNSKYFDIRKIVQQFEKLANNTDKNKEGNVMLKEMISLISKAEDELRLRQGNYIHVLTSLNYLKLFWPLNNQDNTKILKKKIQQTLSAVQIFKNNNESLHHIAALMYGFIRRHENESPLGQSFEFTQTNLNILKANEKKKEEMAKLVTQVFSFLGLTLNELKTIQDLKYDLCLNEPENLEQSVIDMEECYAKLLDENFNQLGRILLQMDNEMDTMQRNYLMKSLEITLLDITSIMKWSNGKFLFISSYNYLDSPCPVISGAQLRNYLAHKDPVFDILTIKPDAQVRCNAKKILDIYKKGDFNRNNRFMFGCCFNKVKFNMSMRYDYNRTIIEEQEQFFQTLRTENLQKLLDSLQKGGDIKAKDLRLRTSLHYAATNNHLNVTRFLVTHGLDPNCRDLNENTAYHLSIKCGNTIVTEYFLTECNIDKNASAKISCGPMNLATGSESLEMINLLLKNKIDIANEEWLLDPIVTAIVYRQTKIALTLLKCEKNYKRTTRGFEYLQHAAENGLFDVVKYLLDMGVNISGTNETGICVLHAAVVGGNHEIVKLLLQKGANPNVKSMIGATPLIKACEEGNEDNIKVLLEYGADPTAVEHVYGRNALHMIGIFGCIKGTEYLLSHERVDAHATTSDHTQAIHFAAGYGHVEIIQMLIDRQVDVNAQTKEKVTPLQLAAFFGHLNAVKFLLKNGAKINMVSQGSKHWWNLSLDPLRCATVKGHIDIVKYLVSNGAKTNSAISTHALELAALNGHDKIISVFLQKGGKVTSNLFEAAVKKWSIFEVLINHKLDINKVDSNGFSLLHHAAKCGKTSIVKRLIELGANIHLETKDRLPDTALSLAIAENHIAVVRILLKCGALVKRKGDPIDLLSLSLPQGNTTILELLLKENVFDQQDKKQCLYVSVWCGFVDMVDILLKHVSLRDQPEFAANLLRTAIAKKHIIVTKMILSKGVNINITADTYPDLTLLHIASMVGCAELVKCLIDYGARIDDETIDKSQALHYAVIHGNLACAEILIERGADVNARDMVRRQPIEFAVANNDVDMVECLLATKRINVNKKIADDITLLHIAAQKGNLEATEMLCDHKANIHARNDFGSKPIHHAARDGHINIVEFYLNKGLSVNEYAGLKKTLLHNAVWDLDIDNSSMIAYLYSRGADLNAVCEEHLTPLDNALLERNKIAVRVLCNLGAIYTIPENAVASPFDKEPLLAQIGSTKKLFDAVKTNNYKEIERLIKHCSGQINGKNDKNITILHFAAWKGYLESVKIALKYGANPNIIGKDGSTALHYAAKFKNFEIVKELLQHGAIYNKKTTHGKTAMQLTEDTTIQKLFEMIEKSFNWIKDGNERIVRELNKITDFEMLKAIVRAKNENSETIMLAAERNSLDFTTYLQQLKQEVTGLEYQRKIEIFFATERFSEALTFLKEIRQKRSILFEEDCPGNLSIDYWITMTVYKQDKYDLALELCKKVLDKRIELLGENAKNTLESGAAKALILLRLGKNVEALEVLAPVIQKYEKYFGNNSCNYFDCQITLGLIYQELKNFQEALKAYTVAFEGWKKLYGHNNPKTLVAQNNIGVALGLLGRNDEALKTFEDVYARRKKILGPNHSATLRTKRNMSDIHLTAKTCDESLKLLESVWDSQKKSLGINHVDSLRTQMKIGTILSKEGKNYLAIKHYNEALPKITQILGPNHPDILVYQKQLTETKMLSKASGYDELNKQLTNKNEELFKAVISGNLTEIERLVNFGASVNGKDDNGFTPLHFAVRNNNKAIIEFLLEKSADPTQTSNKGNSPLHTAASAGHIESARILLKFVKNHSVSNIYDFLNGQTKNGKMTPLHVAAKGGFVEIVKILLKNGAIYDLKEANGLKPIDLSNNEQIKKWLKCCDEIFAQALNKDIKVMKKLLMLKMQGEKQTLSIVTSTHNSNNKSFSDIFVDNFASENHDFNIMNFI